MVLNGATDLVKTSKVRHARRTTTDRDGMFNEIPTSIVDFMEFYLFNYFKPGTYQHTNTAQIGQNLMAQIGCTTCHIPNLVVNRDRRVADVETAYDPSRGIFNKLFAVASLLVGENDDGSGFPDDQGAAAQLVHGAQFLRGHEAARPGPRVPRAQLRRHDHDGCS